MTEYIENDFLDYIFSWTCLNCNGKITDEEYQDSLIERNMPPLCKCYNGVGNYGLWKLSIAKKSDFKEK